MEKEWDFYWELLLGLILLLIFNAHEVYTGLVFKHQNLKWLKNDPVAGTMINLSQAINLQVATIRDNIFISPGNEILANTQTNNVISPGATVTPTAPFQIIEPTPLVVEELYLESPLKFLIVGDSLVIDNFGTVAEQRLKLYTGFEVVREGRYSTGLNRIDYFDWYAQTQNHINSFHPDVMIVFFGANDGQTIVDRQGISRTLLSPEWDVAYQERVHSYLTQFSPQVKRIYWIGHPIPRTQDFHNKFTHMNKIYKAEAELFDNVTFVDTWDRFAVNGAYAPLVADDAGLSQYVKLNDGVHLTTHGGKILMDLLYKYMQEDIVFPDPQTL